jgi:hypothetical protein
MEPRKAMCDHNWLFTLLTRSLVKHPIVGTEPRAMPVINHVGVTNVARHRLQEKPGSIISLCIPGTRGSSIGRRGSSIGWRGSSMVAHQTVVLQSRVQIQHLPSPQLTANLLVGCHLGKALGCGLTSMRGNRGENYKNGPLVHQKHTKEKKE